ncbi:MAG TPA: hypothetical protein DDW30_03605 [Clostridiales bacterium]|nr:hypothetical protein [Clostridiales bacterium]
MQLPDIRISDSGVWCNPDLRVRTPARFVSTYEIELYRKTGGETVINDTVCEIRENRILFCRPGDIRYSNFAPQDPAVRIEFLYFSATSESDGTLDALSNKIPHYIDADPSLLRLWGDLTDTRCAAPAASRKAEEQLRLLLLLYRLSAQNGQSLPPTSLPAGRQAVYDSIRYMRAHLTEPLPVEVLAARIGYSPSRFNNLFKELTGHTPHAFHITLKLEEAKRLLLSTDRSVTEISESLAFSKPCRFSAAFRRAYRLTPGQFRRSRSVPYRVE